MAFENTINQLSFLDISKKTALNIIYTQNCFQDTFHEMLKPFGISSEQFNVLRILRGQKGKPANMALILERMLAKTSNTTRLVDKLLLKEYVTREVCQQNRRKIEVQITSKGLELLLKLDPLVINHENSYSSKLSNDELLKLNHLLEKYRK